MVVIHTLGRANDIVHEKWDSPEVDVIGQGINVYDARTNGVNYGNGSVFYAANLRETDNQLTIRNFAEDIAKGQISTDSLNGVYTQNHEAVGVRLALHDGTFTDVSLSDLKAGANYTVTFANGSTATLRNARAPIVNQDGSVSGYRAATPEEAIGTASFGGNLVESINAGIQSRIDAATPTEQDQVRTLFLAAGALATDGLLARYLGIAAESTATRSLYHYTNEEGRAGILSSQELRPSLWKVGTKDVRYGDGQYLSDIVPGQMTPAQLSRAFLNQPFQGSRFTHFVEIDVSGLTIVRGRSGVYVVPNRVSLDLSRRIINSGTISPKP